MNPIIFQIIVQSIGAIGITASVISFQCATHKNMLVFKSLNEFLFAVQYLLLGAYTGFLLNIAGCVRNIIFTKNVEKKKSNIPWQVFFSALFLIFMVFTWAGFKSALSGIAKVLSTVAYGCSKTSIVRMIVFVTTISWFIYNLLVGSIAGCLCELFTLSSIIVGFIRIDLPLLLKKAER